MEIEYTDQHVYAFTQCSPFLTVAGSPIAEGPVMEAVMEVIPMPEMQEGAPPAGSGTGAGTGGGTGSGPGTGTGSAPVPEIAAPGLEFATAAFVAAAMLVL